MSFAVFVATTGGPVRVERITRERAPQSMVCLKRSSTVLPISAAYDSFVRPGSGVVERIFGPFENGSFRLDVSAPIETGESWQLGVFVAHALCAAREGGAPVGLQDNAEAVVWLTGQVDYDLAVGSVGHLAEKVHASRDAISGWLAAGRAVTMFVPEGIDYTTAVAAGVPEGARLVSIGSATEALVALNLPSPGGTALAPVAQVIQRHPRRGVAATWLAGMSAAIAFAGVAVGGISLWDARPGLAPAATERLERANLEPPPIAETAPQLVAAQSPVVQPVQTPTQQPVAIEHAAAPINAVKDDAPPTEGLPKLVIFERRAPVGRNCAEVQFADVSAVEVPVGAPAFGTSVLQGLCGLGVAVDNGIRPQFVAVVLNVVSGRLLSGTVKPAAFGGQISFTGQQEWAIDLPRRLAGPFEIRVVAIGGDQSVADEAHWLSTQSDAAAAMKELSSKGFATSMLNHRVMP